MTASHPQSNWREKALERVVDDYSSFCDGDFEPSLNKTIRTLIYHTKTYIVYLDQDLYVEWGTNALYGDYPPEFGRVTNKMAHLEALSMTLLSGVYLKAFRRLLGESLARALGEGKVDNALAILDQAEAYMNARSRERARIWYLSSSSLVTIVVLLAVFSSWLFKNEAAGRIGRTTFEILLGAGMGSLGALLSIITRSNQISMDASAGKPVHYLEAAARVIVGMIGAGIVALAIKANIILGTINSLNSLTLLIVVCIIAGASERIVPNLIKHIESSIASKK